MPSTPWIPAVNTVKDGTDVSAAVVNPILAQFTQREQYLKEYLDSLTNQSVLTAYSQPILPTSVGDVKKNSVVYYDTDGTNYGLSLAETSFAQKSINTTAYTPANSCYVFGIVSSVSTSPDTADVFISGLVNFSQDINIDSVDNPSILEAAQRVAPEVTFEPGPLFLSRVEPGKLTRNPGGVAIYVGYAISRTQLFLSPDVTEFNQFFTAFRYTILDRPAGYPVYDTEANGGDGGWTIGGSASDNLKRVGWVPVNETYLGTDIWTNHVPVDSDGNKPAFFYNIPDSTDLSNDSGITVLDRTQQSDLGSTLPPNPVNFTLLTANGVIQANSDLDGYGVYTINEVGLWWWSNYQDQQPWASDILPYELVTFQNGGTHVTFTHGHNLEIGDALVFSVTGGSLPSELTADTVKYFVKSIIDSSVITVAATHSSSAPAISFSSSGSGTKYVRNPYVWKFSKGSEVARPKLLLQFLKFNPTLAESIVTSVRPYNPASTILRFYNSNRTTISGNGTGDLLFRLLLSYVSATPLESSGTAIASLTYDEPSGNTLVTSAPVVSRLIAGNGISVTPASSGGIIQPGQFIVSNNSNTQSGFISSVEPDGAELIFSGLHSYLEMPNPSVLPSSFVGKIMLPAGGPVSDLKLVFIIIGSTGLAANAVNRNVSFDFSYAVTKPGLPLTPAASPTTITFAIPLTSSGYVAKTCFKVGAGLTASTFSIPISELTIPSTSFLAGDCAINFKIARSTPGSNAYTNPVGIVDMYWKIG
jgi:hypothetical protein